jgi:uncharacterized protein (TIGR02678 family)
VSATTPRIQRPAPAEDPYAVAERRQAARALLRRPLLTADGHADDFRLVRRHREELARLFADGLGYRLVVEPTTARLFKSGLGRDGTRGLRKRSSKTDSPFTPRAYALLCLTVAALTRCKDQLLIDELVAQVRSAAADAPLDLDLDAMADRRALLAVIRALVDLGVLRERDGSLDRWAEDRRVQSLLDVSRERLRLLVAAPLSAATSPDELLDRAALPSAAGGARVAVRRRLVESPVLSVSDLTEEQAEWWGKNRNREREWFRERLGVDLELRAEGALAVDPDTELSDVEFPGGGSARHFALLLVERLATALRDPARDAELSARTWRAAPPEVVDTAAVAVVAAYGKGFRKDHREDQALLRAEAVDVLTGMGLVRVEADGTWLVHAAAARYATAPALVTQRSLFDEGD